MLNNIKRFKFEHPSAKSLSNEECLFLFKVYKRGLNRSFEAENITLVVCGTLIILISFLFMNGGASRNISNITQTNSPNNIVMNTVISSATSGLTLMLMDQFTNIFQKELLN